jgi:hypothetical protein
VLLSGGKDLRPAAFWDGRSFLPTLNRRDGNIQLGRHGPDPAEPLDQRVNGKPADRRSGQCDIVGVTASVTRGGGTVHARPLDPSLE